MHIPSNILISQMAELLVLDAPCGAGKTTAIKTLLEARGSPRTLSITFRVSLAESLASALDLFSYRNPVFKNNLRLQDKISICLDSIIHLKNLDYNTVILDEVVFILFHFVGGTIKVPVQTETTEHLGLQYA